MTGWGPLLLLSGALMATSAGIAWKQKRARSCPRHRPAAGRAAWALAVACVASALASGGYVLLAWLGA